MREAKCEISLDEGILVMRISGDIDHHSVADIREEMDAAIFRYRTKTCIIDLGEVGFMDSSGLGLILGRYTKIDAFGSKLIVTNPDAATEKILRLAGCERLITIKKVTNTQKEETAV